MDDECEKELGRPISSLKVTELRDELTKRALTKTGNKKELIDRLRGAIQRQSSYSSPNQQAASIDQVNLQQQHLSPQTVQQFIGTSVAMQQQNQGAVTAAVYQHQLNQIQPQPQLSTYAVAMNQQHYQGSAMQPLDLQQQQTSSTDYQTQVQFGSAEYQQQQQQLNPQQYQAPLEVAHPPIDMRVTPTLKQTASPEEQTIDLSSGSSKLRQTQERLNETIDSSTGQLATEEQDEQSKLPDEISESETTSRLEEKPTIQSRDDATSDQKTQKVVDDTSKEKVESSEDDREHKTVEKGAGISATISGTAITADETSTLDRPDAQAATGDTGPHCVESSKSQDLSMEEEKDQQSQSSEPPTAEAKKLDEAEVHSLSTSSISLKRSLSDNRDSCSSSSSKEKKRRWQSKAPEKLETFQDEASQLPIISGGLSSAKLQELIDVQKEERGLANEEVKSKSVSNATQRKVDEPQGQKQVESSKPTEQPEDSQTLREKDDEKAKVEQKETLLENVEQELEPTNSLLVENLVRPFTIMQLKEVLTKHGSMIEDKFWTDKVKSKCCVMYETVEVAKATKESLHGQQWPSSNPKTLKVTYITEEAISKYQSSERVKTTEIEVAVNGSNAPGKSITDRLGEKLDDGVGSSNAETIKKRLGERTSGDLGTKSSNVNRDGDGDDPKPQLDDLFKRTKAIPNLFWLPLSEELADIRQKEREERKARIKEVIPKPRRSPPRHRSPIRNRSPIIRRSPPRYRSPNRHRSPPRHRLSPRYRSRSPMDRRRFPIRQRSPLLRRTSPRRLSPRRSPLGRSPLRRSPIPPRRSPFRRPSPRRISPSINRVSPPIRRRSPALIRRSPMLRSPPHIRRSPAPIRGPSPTRRSPVRKRSPLRRRSPTRHTSPERSMDYVSEQRRLQRLDRLR